MKKNLNYYPLFLGLVMGTLIPSCASNPLADLTAVSTRRVETGNIDLTKLPSKKVTGKDIGFSFFMIPIPPYLPPSMDDAVEDALRKGNGDLLLSAYIVEKTYFAGIIFNLVGYEVTGRVVNTKDAKK